MPQQSINKEKVIHLDYHASLFSNSDNGSNVNHNIVVKVVDDDYNNLDSKTLYCLNKEINIVVTSMRDRLPNKFC